MLYTEVKNRGKAQNCEVHVIGDGQILLKRFYKNIPDADGNGVLYTPRMNLTKEQFLVALGQIVERIKHDGLLHVPTGFSIEKQVVC